MSTKFKWMLLRVVLLLLPLSATRALAEPEPGSADYHSLARGVFAQTNRLRSDPAQYIEILTRRRARFEGLVYVRQDNPVRLRTQEGVKPYDEAIEVLTVQKPLAPLVWSDRLAALAAAHVNDTGPKGIIGHVGSNGDDFSARSKSLEPGDRGWGAAENISYGTASGDEVVVQLFVDDGVPGRGHRVNILNEQMRYSGVSCGYHQTFRTMCVAIYSYGTE